MAVLTVAVDSDPREPPRFEGGVVVGPPWLPPFKVTTLVAPVPAVRVAVEFVVCNAVTLAFVVVAAEPDSPVLVGLAPDITPV